MFRVFDFLVYCFIMAYTPGANNLLSMTYAARFGFKRSIRFNFGITIGFFVVMGICAVFTTSLFTALPQAKPVLQIVGALYMLYLAWGIFRGGGSHDDKSGDTLNGMLFSGMFLQFMNAKIYLYAITALSAYVLPVYDSKWILALFVLILTVIGASGSYVWAVCGAVLSGLYAKYEKGINIVMALLLVYCAIAMFL